MSVAIGQPVQVELTGLQNGLASRIAQAPAVRPDTCEITAYSIRHGNDLTPQLCEPKVIRRPIGTKPQRAGKFHGKTEPSADTFISFLTDAEMFTTLRDDEVYRSALAYAIERNLRGHQLRQLSILTARALLFRAGAVSRLGHEVETDLYSAGPAR